MSSNPMELKAIDSNAVLGSYYDPHEDRIIEEKNGRCLWCNKLEIAESKLLYGESVYNVNLLSLIGFEVNSRLNILLKPIPKTGLTPIITYPFPIDKYTRILHYTYTRHRQNLVCNRLRRLRCCCSRPVPDNATHRIVKVTWGIEFVVLLRLPHDQDTVTKIDAVLTTLHINLSARDRQRNRLTLTQDEAENLKKITDTHVYSNSPGLANMKTIAEIYQNIHLLQKKNEDHLQPIMLTLQPVNQIDLPNDPNIAIKKRIEDHLLPLLKGINYVKGFLERLESPPSSEPLNEPPGAIATIHSQLVERYHTEVQRWKSLINGSRNGEILPRTVEDMLQNEQSQELINDLHKKPFHYHRVPKEDVRTLADMRNVVQQLIQNGQYDRCFCSTDSLNKNRAEFHKAQDQFVKDHAHKPTLRLLYADFSSCIFQLPNIIVITKENINNILPNFNDDCINILLVGESGVGKSTFINALVNYLTFDSLGKAELSQPPVVAIPVSFLITTGDNFDEHIVKFGTMNSDDNEDFDHPGQSVTQQCRCYHLNLHRQDEKDLRIIDTPGFGDTRGLDQDDRNIQHIFQYLHGFSHINAICFLLKSNSSRLVTSFRSCLLQLNEILDSNTRQNIIFCFTNARTSFYTPGDTAPLLRAMLNTLPSKDIQFKKDNVFCFDNEAFRYLVALQNGIEFTELDRNEYEQSWTTSVKQSNRMIDYICQTLRPCLIRAE